MNPPLWSFPIIKVAASPVHLRWKPSAKAAKTNLKKKEEEEKRKKGCNRLFT